MHGPQQPLRSRLRSLIFAPAVLATWAWTRRHRSTLDDEPVKSLDFVVYGADGSKLLVDVKGRRFPGGRKDRPRRVWETWSTRDDIDGLDRWAERFGAGYLGLLVFVYRIVPTVLLPLGTPDLWAWHDRFYLLRAVTVADYRRTCASAARAGAP